MRCVWRPNARGHSDGPRLGHTCLGSWRIIGLGMGRQLALFTALCWALLCCSRGGAPPAAPADAAARPVPVLVVQTAAADVPIYLEGLGTAVAWKTVTVRPQVDGKLEAVLFRDGQTVKRGQLLARLDSRPFAAQWDQAFGAAARDQALLNNHRQTLRRYQTLRAENHIAQQVVDDGQALVAQYEGALAVDKAQLATARLNFAYTRITAPIDGVVGVRIVDEGNVVRASDPGGLVVITQIEPISVLFTLSEDDLPQVVARMRDGPVAVEIFHRQGSAKLGTGQLLAIDNQINASTAMVRLKAMLPNGDHRLWPNQFVKARLLLNVRKKVLLIPAVAVQRGPKGTFAYVVQKGDVAAPIPVEVETQIGDQVIIARGLSIGDAVVIEGQGQLRPGSKVLPRRVDAAPSAGEPVRDPGKQDGSKP